MDITLYNGKPVKINRNYISGLKGKEKRDQIESILEGKDRPKTSYKSKRSSWCQKFENKYDTNINDKEFIHDNLLEKKGQKQIIDKGKAAYYTSGSRPNQTAESWGKARMYAYILGSPTRKVDHHITKKYKVKFKNKPNYGDIS